MMRDSATAAPNKAIAQKMILYLPPEGKHKPSNVTAATTVMLCPEGMAFAAVAGRPMVWINPGSSTPKGLGWENQDLSNGDAKDPIKKHFKESAVPFGEKRVNTSNSNSAAPPSPNCVKKDQKGSAPVTMWFRLTIHS